MIFKNITVVGEDYQVQEGMFLCTEGNQIIYLGKEAPQLESYHGEIYDGKNKAVLPGFFNIHTHLPMTLLRGYGEGLPLDRWLTERVFPFEALLTPEDMYWGTTLAMAELMASGTVSFSDMYMELPGILPAVDAAGMKANLSHGAASSVDSPAVFSEVSGYQGLRYLAEATAALPHDRIRADVGIHAEYTTNEPMVRTLVDYAKDRQLRLQVHLSETRREHNDCILRRGMTPSCWFNRLGAFDLPTTAAHGVWLMGEDFEILAKKGVTVAHCPSSNLKLGSGFAKVEQMQKSGISVGIGTDGAASNNNLNMLEEISLAALVQKGVTGNPQFLPPTQLLEMACANGAAAQGRADCGTIRVGNRADLFVVDLDKPHLLPSYDLLANIFYAAQAGDIVLTMVDGQVVYQNGAYLTIDLEQAKHHVQRITKEKLKQLAPL